jgi:hypothetical protein
MAAKFKMNTKTKLAYVAKKTLVWPIQLCVFIDFGLEKIRKILENSKIKNGCSIQDGRKNLIYFSKLQTVYFINFFLSKKLSKYLIFIKYFFSQIFKMTLILNITFFWHLFLARQKLQNAKVLHILEEQTT